MKQLNYYVIGGQYESYCYGGTPTLIGAKRLATKCTEFWDNWQGWHKPDIYRAEDTEVVESYGRFFTEDGCEVRVPKPDAEPVAYWRDGRWIENG